jgi:hypothetical protein
MNDEAYNALKSILEEAKTEHRMDTYMKEDFFLVEAWIDETAKEHLEDVTYCHLCGGKEEDHYCTNETCAEYTKHEGMYDINDNDPRQEWHN